MRFVVATLGSTGMCFRFSAWPSSCDRGHEILFATNAHFEGLIRRHGFAFEELGTEESYQATIRNPDLWSPQRPFRTSFVPSLRCSESSTTSLPRRDATPFRLWMLFGFGGLLAQEKLGIRTITVHLQPTAVSDASSRRLSPACSDPDAFKNFVYNLGERLVIDPVVCPFLNSWRAELGLPPVRRISRWWHSPFSVVCLFPDWFCPVQPDWPANIITTTFPLWNEGSADSLSPKLEAFLAGGSPPIVFTPGTANIHAREFFQTAVEACRQLDRRAILLTQHPEQLPASLPAAIHAEQYVPLDRLLPRSAAFAACRARSIPTSQALLAGLPQVLMPLANDQFDNAVRIEKLGAGAGIPAVRFTVRASKSP